MGKTSNTTPAPVDYTGSMVNASNNQLVGQLAQTSTQSFLGQLMAFNQSQQIATNGQTALEALDAKVEIARMNFQLAEEGLDVKRDQLEQQHDEKMRELDVREAEINKPAAPTTEGTGWGTV